MGERIAQIVDAAINMATIPSVALKFIQKLNAGEVTIDGLVNIVKADPILAAKVLQIANAPMYGASRDVRSIWHAINLVGASVTRSILMSNAMRASVSPGDTFEHGIWVHSAETAFVAREIAGRLGQVSPEEAFTAGLLHDIGLIAMHRFAPQEVFDLFSERREPTRDFGGSDSDCVVEPCLTYEELTVAEEEELIGAAHGHVGGGLCRRWGLPAEVANAVSVHQSCIENGKIPFLVDIVYVANAISLKYGQGLKLWCNSEIHDFPAAKRLGLTPRVIDKIAHALAAESQLASRDT